MNTFSTISRRLRSILAAVLVMSSMLVPATSHAIIPVIDAANLTANTWTSIQQYLNTAQAYISAAEDIKQTAREITAFDAAAVFLDDDDQKALMQFIETGKNLQGVLRQTEDIYTDFQRVFTTSKFKDINSFLDDFGKRKDAGDKMAKSLYDAARLAESQLQKAADQHLKILDDMPNIIGVTDAALATAQTVGTLVQQSQGMLQLMAANTRQSGQELQRQYDERAKREEAQKAMFEHQRTAVESDKGLVN